MSVVGTLVKAQRFKCGGAWTECEVDHEFFRPQDILILDHAVMFDDFRCEDHGWTEAKEARALEDGTLYRGDKGVVPTLLGWWLEDSAVN